MSTNICLWHSLFMFSSEVCFLTFYNNSPNKTSCIRHLKQPQNGSPEVSSETLRGPEHAMFRKLKELGRCKVCINIIYIYNMIINDIYVVVFLL